jgi:hypothetical protein
MRIVFNNCYKRAHGGDRESVAKILDKGHRRSTGIKMLKRAMYGSAGIDLLRARMMPLNTIPNHTK